jgi:hypothetical protein
LKWNFKGERAIFRVKKFYANGQIWFTPANNAQQDADQMKQKTTWSKSPNTLRPLNPRNSSSISSERFTRPMIDRIVEIANPARLSVRDA